MSKLSKPKSTESKKTKTAKYPQELSQSELAKTQGGKFLKGYKEKRKKASGK